MNDEKTPTAEVETPNTLSSQANPEAAGTPPGHSESRHDASSAPHSESISAGEPSPETSETPTTAETEDRAHAGEESHSEHETAKSAAKKPRKAKAIPETTPASEGPEIESKSAAKAPTPPTTEGGAEGASEHAKKWYVVKVQSGREDSIKAAIERKVKIEGLEEFFGQIAIPVEEIVQKKSVRVTDKKTGDKVTQEKKVIKYNKKFPGYLFAEVEFNDRILYLFRETSGVGDFVGASMKRDPTPMTDREVRSMLTGVADGDPKNPGQKKVKLDYEKGDKVKIRDGAFANMEGIVKSITDTKDTGETPKVEVEVHIFGRPVQVVLDYWHVDRA